MQKLISGKHNSVICFAKKSGAGTKMYKFPAEMLAFGFLQEDIRSFLSVSKKG
ncbi:MAG: hypothetical protein K0S33_2716 [Bacteroidetes bacterium]|jgi:hypothetical protein|nr:hypothetical protein [Bacteroidota bacterium]